MKRLLVALLAILSTELTTTRAQVAPESKLGLVVVAEPGRAAIKAGEPILLRVTFRNTSNQDFRLPDRVIPAAYNYWYLKLQEAATGKTYTGISTRPMGAAPEPGEIHPQLIRAGEVKTVSVAFLEFAFVEGDMDFQAARNIWFPQRGNGAFALPDGTYNVRANVLFRSFPNRPNLPQEILEAQRAIVNNPIPLWAGGEIQSSPIRITVSREAVMRDTETFQIARDSAICLLDLLQAIQEDSNLAGLRAHAGLAGDLRAIANASNAVKNSDGRDVSALRSGVQALRDSVVQAAMRALEISRRTNERPEDRVQASQLAMMLQGFPAPILGSTN